jgi:Ca2+ transporting ATPase
LQKAATTNSLLYQLSTIATCCNDAKIVYEEPTDSFQRIGEPTEAALLSMVEKVPRQAIYHVLGWN